MNEDIEAIKPALPSIPHKDAPCHLAITSQDNCGYCQRIIKAHEALTRIEQQLQARDELQTKYHELLYGVASKFPNESRHETALRYILNAENHDYGMPQCEAAQPPKQEG